MKDSLGMGAGNRAAWADTPALAGDAQAFLRHLRHGLRTPVNHIVGYSEMLLEEAQDERATATSRDLQRIHAAGVELLERLNEIFAPASFDLATLDAARVDHELRTHLNAIIGYSDLLREEAGGPGRERFTADLQTIHAAGVDLLARVDGVLRLARTGAPPPAGQLPAPALSAKVQLEPSAGAGAWRVLVVDDDQGNRDLLTRRLERLGYRVAMAASGEQALARVRAEPWDLVLLDLVLPGLDGFAVLRRLKADPDTRDIPVIVLSALDDLTSVAACIELGADDYLPKPFSPVLLRARVGASLEKKRWHDQDVLYRRQIEAERRRTDELLHVILPDEIVDELKETDAVRPRRYEDVAVLFCDVVGFTGYCDARPAEEVVAHLQALVETYEALALEHGLQKVKTIGDAFMAVAGLLRPVPDPVLASLETGLAFIAAARRLPPGWEVRVGIHVGPVVAGVIGRRQYSFDLWGDTVNTAARVESNGTPGAVTLSANAWARIADRCQGESLGRVAVKGKRPQELFVFRGFTRAGDRSR